MKEAGQVSFKCRPCGQQRSASEFYYSNGKHNAWCKACYRDWYQSRYTPNTGWTDDPRQCQNCGIVFVPRQRRESWYCTRYCKDVARRQMQRERLAVSKPDRSCLHCGRSIPNAMRVDAVFCSESCNNAAHSLTRQSVKRGGGRPDGLILRAVIADRDGWCCGLCYGPVDPGVAWPDPMYGSVDHVVPLARGGANEPDNLQLAHLRCNASKGARLAS